MNNKTQTFIEICNIIMKILISHAHSHHIHFSFCMGFRKFMNGTMTAMGKVCLYDSFYHINHFFVPIKIVGIATIVDRKFVHFVECILNLMKNCKADI